MLDVEGDWKMERKPHDAGEWQEKLHIRLYGRLEVLRFYLMREYLGAGDASGGRWPGNESFRQRLLDIVDCFRPNLVQPTTREHWGRIRRNRRLLPRSERLDARLEAGLTIAEERWGFILNMPLPDMDVEVRGLLKQYVDAIKQAAHQFGLRSARPDDTWWGYEWIHTQLSGEITNQEFFGLPRLSRGLLEGTKTLLYVHPSKTFTISWKMFPDSDHELQRERVLSLFDAQWQEGGQYLEKALSYSGGDSKLMTQTRWVYLAICPDEELEHPLAYKEIVDREAEAGCLFDEKTVAGSVRRLRRKLEIASDQPKRAHIESQARFQW